MQEAEGLSAVLSGLPRTRRETEAWLDAFVDGNRFTIAVFFPLIGAIMLLGSAESWSFIPAPLRFNVPLILFGTIVMAAPLIVGVIPAIDRRALGGVGVLVGYTYLIEYVGVSTGWPYGTFEYGISLGPMIGDIPAALPVFFLPIVLNTYVLSLLLLGDRGDSRLFRLGVVVPAVVAMDVVLDPAAVSLGFWEYLDGGVFYGVPLSNYAGWVLSAAVSVGVLDWTIDRGVLDARLAQCEFLLDDLVSFVILWGVINAWFGNWLAVGVALLFGVAILRAKRFDAGLLRPSTGIYVPCVVDR
ncbi:bisanhydrobacterioruberin hydratase [Halohasta litorea]|uniref:Bisanhydrobacterioruberin hydratase n=1 Tax=Halohasta litorea TaxID=869891 RepID=A0ABD6D7Z2_9EURY|nr:bisanhydrobacterioruberin hydratase [Halohasta litorea]